MNCEQSSGEQNVNKIVGRRIHNLDIIKGRLIFVNLPSEFPTDKLCGCRNIPYSRYSIDFRHIAMIRKYLYAEFH